MTLVDSKRRLKKETQEVIVALTFEGLVSDRIGRSWFVFRRVPYIYLSLQDLLPLPHLPTQIDISLSL